MNFASWLLVTSSLVPAGQPATPTITPSVQVSFAQRQVDRSRKPQTPRPHQFGLGTNITAGNRGAGGSFRYWFTERVGLDASARWYLGQRLATGDRPSTFQASPSLLFMLTGPHPDREIDLRPYVGGGFNYVNATGRIPNTTTPSGAASSSDRSGVGGQGFGGTEITFKEADRIAISFEVGYYKLPAAFANSIYVGGWNYFLLFTYYLR